MDRKIGKNEDRRIGRHKNRRIGEHKYGQENRRTRE